mmetsp:Transcript_35659/g.6422  ORF Transcript_35659/g.6422 Transcript_35659/m.6422 type:complete len:179 (-) Transcript_35659:2874-3410(-)
MVAFTVMLRISTGEDMGFGDIFLLFVRMSVGGPLIGLISGIVMALWMKRVFRDDILEISLTFFTVYMLFFVSEGTSLHVSGILALVAYGLYMSAWGKTTISVEGAEAVHHFWQFIAYSGETLIFILSGMIIGVMINDGNFEAEDWGKLLGLYALLTLVRALLICLLYPILKRLGYGIN